jgi:hypothetical protein
MRFAISLARSPLACRVLLDGVDISRYIRGLSIRAHVSEGVTTLSLDLIPLTIEVLGEAGEVVREVYGGPSSAGRASPEEERSPGEGPPPGGEGPPIESRWGEGREGG